MKNFLPVAFFLAALMFPQMSSAGFITIETTTSVTVAGDNARVTITTTNKGDEPANNVIINLAFASKQFSGKLKDTLGIKESYTDEFTFPIEFKKAGRYPIIVTVEYTDANLYPFSALSVSYLNFNNPANARVSGTISQTSIADKGKIAVAVNNIDSVERKIHMQLITPKEFMVQGPVTEISVAPAKEKSASFEIRNISALPGSSYPVFAIISYEDDQYYYSTIASGIINIEKQKGFFNIYIKMLTAVLAAFIVLLFYKLIFRRKKNSDTKGLS